MPYLKVVQAGGPDVQETAIAAGPVMRKEQKEERSYGQGR
jgi:hypothetical protein